MSSKVSLFVLFLVAAVLSACSGETPVSETMPVEGTQLEASTGRVTEKGPTYSEKGGHATVVGREGEGENESVDLPVTVPTEVSGAFLVCLRLSETEVGCVVEEDDSGSKARVLMAHAKSTWTVKEGEAEPVLASISRQSTVLPSVQADGTGYDVILTVDETVTTVVLTLQYGEEPSDEISFETVISAS